MTISLSPYDSSLTVRFSQMVEFKLFPWFGEAFTAHAHLNYPLFGLPQPIQRLFPGYVPTYSEDVRVFAASLEFAGPKNHESDVPKDVCLKLARGVDEVVHLSHEASVYRRLFKLWGIAVPRMYGFFIGHYQDTPVACLLLELCPGPTENSPSCDVDEFVRRAMLSLRRVHTLDITQNSAVEMHHFVMKGDKVLLVDFSRAVTHHCNNAIPVYSNQRFVHKEKDAHEEDDGHDCSEFMTTAAEAMRAASVRY